MRSRRQATSRRPASADVSDRAESTSPPARGAGSRTDRLHLLPARTVPLTARHRQAAIGALTAILVHHLDTGQADDDPVEQTTQDPAA